jgi:isopentenyl-diphosphate delta-isomerase
MAAAAQPEEIADWKWINLDDLREDLRVNPQSYTPWFKIAIDEVTHHAPLRVLVWTLEQGS